RLLCRVPLQCLVLVVAITVGVVDLTGGAVQSPDVVVVLVDIEDLAPLDPPAARPTAVVRWLGQVARSDLRNGQRWPGDPDLAQASWRGIDLGHRLAGPDTPHQELHETLPVQRLEDVLDLVAVDRRAVTDGLLEFVCVKER